jgi:hypothetical protein
MTVDWRKLRIEELCNLNSCPGTLKVIKSGRMRRTGHVARMLEVMYAITYQCQMLKRNDHLAE